MDLAAPSLTRYNGYEAVDIVGSQAPGKSTGQAMDADEEHHPRTTCRRASASTGPVSRLQEILSGEQAPMLFALSILVVFLCLAALYESWSIPVAVLLVVPLGVTGALLATWARGLSNDVYLQDRHSSRSSAWRRRTPS